MCVVVGGYLRYVLYKDNLDGRVDDRRFVPVVIPFGFVPGLAEYAVRTWGRTGGVIQARQWADAPEVSATGALLLLCPCVSRWRGAVTGKRTGAARGLPAPGPGTPLMQCVIHYLMETAQDEPLLS